MIETKSKQQMKKWNEEPKHVGEVVALPSIAEDRKNRAKPCRGVLYGLFKFCKSVSLCSCALSPGLVWICLLLEMFFVMWTPNEKQIVLWLLVFFCICFWMLREFLFSCKFGGGGRKKSSRNKSSWVEHFESPPRDEFQPIEMKNDNLRPWSAI